MPMYMTWDEEKKDHEELKQHQVDFRAINFRDNGEAHVGLSLSLQGKDVLVLTLPEVKNLLEGASDFLQKFETYEN